MLRWLVFRLKVDKAFQACNHWAATSTTSYQMNLNNWHLLLKTSCSKFLIKAAQSHNVVSTRFFKSDDKKLCCLIPNNRDCQIGMTSFLRLILRLSSMTKY